MLFVAVDVEMFTAARSLVSDRLVGEIYLDLHLRIVPDTLEHFGEEFLCHLYGQYEVIEFIILMDIGKERTDDYTEAITRDGPSRVLATGARTEILACHEDAAAIGGVVEYKILDRMTILIITPVTEEVVAKTFLVSGLEKTGWYDLVGIHILQRKGNAGRCDNIKLLLHLFMGLMGQMGLIGSRGDQ